jgi:hypothetical protein
MGDRMNLLTANYFGPHSFMQRAGDGSIVECKRYGYESAGTLYDVSIGPRGKWYSTNMRTVAERTPIHAAIERHFAI